MKSLNPQKAFMKFAYGNLGTAQKSMQCHQRSMHLQSITSLQGKSHEKRIQLKTMRSRKEISLGSKKSQLLRKSLEISLGTEKHHNS